MLKFVLKFAFWKTQSALQNAIIHIILLALQQEPCKLEKKDFIFIDKEEAQRG